MQNAPVQTLSFAQLVQKEPWTNALIHVQKGGLLLWVTRGQGVINLHGVRRGFSSHNAIYIPSGHLWSVDFGRQTLGQAVFLTEEVAQSFPQTEQLLRIKDGLAQSELTGLIEDIRREIMNDRPFLEDALSAQAAMLGIWVKRQIELTGAPAKPRAAERLMRRFCDLAAKGVGSGKVMADYAEALNVTPTHLTRVCRQTAGMTAADILVQSVLHEARRQLLDSSGSIKSISDDLGFGSPAYFTRFIQQHSGKTPSRLRQTAKIRV